MSNCVDIHNDIVVTSEFFKIDAFFDDMATHDYVNKPGFDRFFAPEASNEEFFFYWFIGPDSFYLEDGNLIIALGQHRSGHTQRDLKGLGIFLSKYLRNVKDDEGIICPCEMSDEYDGFATRFSQNFFIGAKND